MKKRPPPSGLDHLNNPPFSDPEFRAEYPNIHDFLSAVKWDDGTPRITGSLVFFVKSGILTCSVNDKSRELAAFVNAPTWADLLVLLDVGICDDKLDWKPSAKPNPKGPIPF